MSSTHEQIDRGIVVYGAGGQVGRAVVTEARLRGLAVTAAVRDPERHPDLADEGVTLVRCDVTDPADVAAAAHGHAAAVSTVYTPDVPSADFYRATADALATGLGTAEVRRLVHVGVATTLETAPGTAVHDDPDFPEAYRTFSLGHALALDLLRESDTSLDWVVVTPPLDLDRTAPEPAATGPAARRSSASGSPRPTSRSPWSTNSPPPPTTVSRSPSPSSRCGLSAEVGLRPTGTGYPSAAPEAAAAAGHGRSPAAPEDRQAVVPDTGTRQHRAPPRPTAAAADRAPPPARRRRRGPARTAPLHRSACT